jgi:hypothetical protein
VTSLQPVLPKKVSIQNLTIIWFCTFEKNGLLKNKQMRTKPRTIMSPKQKPASTGFEPTCTLTFPCVPNMLVIPALRTAELMVCKKSHASNRLLFLLSEAQP